MKKATNFLILDGEKMFVEGLKELFDQRFKSFKVHALAQTYADLRKMMNEAQTDFIIMDLNIPDLEAQQIIKNIKSTYPQIYILVLSSYDDPKHVRLSMKNGADGFLSKRGTVNELLLAVEEIESGYTYIGKGLRTTPLNKVKSFKSKKTKIEDSFTLKQKLTKREQEILSHLSQGKSNKEIGLELFISDQTVGVHKKNIMKKLGVKNSISLIRMAFEHHLV